MTPIGTLVIGGGQAGLAAAYHLRKSNVDYLVVDASDRIGDSWRKRYRSLTLFTPRQFSSLPGLDLVGNREAYPTRDEFADYLDRYADHFKLNIRLGARVSALRRIDGGLFEARLADGSVIASRSVIIATGGFQQPFIPALDRGLGKSVRRLTADTYRDPSQVPPGTVLVVGDGASGRDIAVELAGTNQTLLATGKLRRLFPERIFGKSTWWWLSLSGVLRAGPETRIGRRIRYADAFPDRNRSIESLRRLSVIVVPRLVAASGSTVTFEDGKSTEIATVIWAVGYRDDSSWLDLPGATDATGSFVHSQGVSLVEGLYFVGRPWQRNRASALVMGAGPDAEQIVNRISKTVAAPTNR